MDVVGIIQIMHRIVIHIRYLQTGCVSHVDEKMISAARSKKNKKQQVQNNNIENREEEEKE